MLRSVSSMFPVPSASLMPFHSSLSMDGEYNNNHCPMILSASTPPSPTPSPSQPLTEKTIKQSILSKKRKETESKSLLTESTPHNNTASQQSLSLIHSPPLSTTPSTNPSSVLRAYENIEIFFFILKLIKR